MVEWIVSSSVLLVVIIALRWMMKGKISLRLQYALWGLVLLRLLIPLNIWSSSLSVMNAAQKLTVIEDAAVISGEEKLEADDSFNGHYPSDFMHNDPAADAEKMAAADGVRMEKLLDLRNVLVSVWLCGAAVLLVAFAVSNRRFASRLRRTRKPLQAEGAALPVYLTTEIDTPCLFGLFRPAIYLTPEAAEDSVMLRHTAEHETTHFRHGDNFWAFLRVACLALHWYNPLVWWAAFLSRNDSELACDEATIKRIGENERVGYGRTLIAMTCRKPTALLITATTMTGSGSSIKERIALIAKKPKTAAYTLIAVILVAAAAAGCTFTGAKKKQEDITPEMDSEEENSFSPDTVTMEEMLSSVCPPNPITDKAAVDYLWSVYQGFEFDGTAETLGTKSMRNITVTFSESASGKSERFTIFEGGICWWGYDFRTDHILVDGEKIYQEFFGYFEAAKKSEVVSKNAVQISVDDLGDVPDDAVIYAKSFVAQQIDAYHSIWPETAPGCSVTSAKITGLTQMNAGTQGTDTGVELYLLQYLLRVDGNVDAVLVGGMSYKEIDGENWLTEWSSLGQPYLLLYCDDSGAEPVWNHICVTNTEEISQYNTSEMLEQHGDFYTAAAMELFKKYK